MFDWQFQEEDDTSVDLPDERTPRRYSRRFWLGLTVAALLIALLVGAGLRWRVAERRQAMRDDVIARVEEEEQARQLGRRERFAEFAAPDAPADWRGVYRQTFFPVDAPIEVEVEDVNIDGQNALVTVLLDGHAQLRYYRLIGRNWRRAPVPVDELWSGEPQTLRAAGVTITYYPRDREFAEQLAQDLPTLLDLARDWSGGAEPALEEIHVRPVDMGGVVLSTTDVRIDLNSPLLLPMPSGNSEAGVRRWLALTLLESVGPTREELAPLPGAERFLWAAQLIAAYHWTAPDDGVEREVESARMQLNGNWRSPFYEPETDGGQRMQAEVAAHLTAAYVYNLGGFDALAEVVRAMTTSDSWDAIFLNAVDRHTVTLEQEAAAYAQGETVAGPSPESLEATYTLPFETTLLSHRANALSVGAVDSEIPVLVERDETSSVVTPDGLPVVLDCLNPGSTVRLDGEWREVGRRLQAETVVVTAPVPPRLADAPDAPADTVAYVAQTRSTGGNTLSDVGVVRADGTVEQLVELPAARRLRLLSRRSDEPVRLIFTYEPENCERSWLVVYEPARGRLHSWLLPPETRLDGDGWQATTWLAEHDALLLFRRTEDSGWAYSTLPASLSFVDPRPTPLDPRLVPIGWSTVLDRIVVLDTALTDGHQRVGLLRVSTQTPRWLDLPTRIQHPTLSARGRWLAYTVPTRTDKGRFDTVHLLDLTDGSDDVLINVGPDEALAQLHWTSDAASEYLMVLSGVRGLQPVPAVRMLAFDPQRPESFIRVTESRGGERLRHPVFCPDGSVLYTFNEAEAGASRTNLVALHEPGAEPVSVLEGRPFELLDCTMPLQDVRSTGSDATE